mmetsp:Transcript_12199/g.35094  ORF Transcript_12199/g.35094 Transcript_12199/m.35094 type:complete len:259 (+) Transcript_12199:537-1313(+)
MRHGLPHGLRVPLGEIALEIRKLRYTLPHGFSRRAEKPEDFEELIDFGVTREKRVAGDHLRNDGADRPYVNWAGVLLCAEQDLGCSIPEGHHLMRVSTQRHSESTGQAEIRQLQRPTLRVDEHVLRLQVPMKDTVGVAPAKTIQHLVRKRLDAGGAKPILEGFHVLLQVEVTELKAQVQLVIIWHIEDVLQLDDVRVLQLLEERHLTQSCARHAFVLTLQLDLLERGGLAGMLMRRNVDFPKGALAQLLATLPQTERR